MKLKKVLKVIGIFFLSGYFIFLFINMGLIYATSNGNEHLGGLTGIILFPLDLHEGFTLGQFIGFWSLIIIHFVMLFSVIGTEKEEFKLFLGGIGILISLFLMTVCALLDFFLCFREYPHFIHIFLWGTPLVGILIWYYRLPKENDTLNITT